jgi:DNA-binding NtrC family response regulator
MSKILLIEDQESYRATLEQALGEEHDVRAVESGERALELAGVEPVDLLITDLKLGGMTGLEVIRRLKRSDPYVEAIVMTAYGTVETAVEAMKEGAYDYITKPFSLDELQLLVSNALERRDLRTTVSRLQKDLQQRYGFARIIGKSGAMQEISRTLIKVAASDATVLLHGESGTGKGLMARAIHHNSPRRERSFVEINCAGSRSRSSNPSSSATREVPSPTPRWHAKV